MIQTRRSSHSRHQRRKAKDRHVRTQRRTLHAERLEERALLAANPFHNGFWPEDVDNSLKVTPSDVLYIINELNHSGSRELLAPEAESSAMASVPYYTDVSDDGALTPLDALRVVNTINNGEGETAPSDIVRYRLRATNLNGTILTNPTVNVGDTFQLRGYVRDMRTSGTGRGVFAGYMDVLMANASNALIRYGETQELRMDATNPGGVDVGFDSDHDENPDTPKVYVGGTFTLTYNGQTTSQIRYYGDPIKDPQAITQALEALSGIGSGNVSVSARQGADFAGRYFVRFKRDLGERNVAAMSVAGQNLTGTDSNNAPFTPTPQIVDNFISVTPTTPAQQEALFRSSFEFVDPYINGPSVVDEPLEAGQPAGSRNLGEVGAFLAGFSIADATSEYNLFVVEMRAERAGTVAFSGNLAENNKTLVFGIGGGSGAKTEVPPENIGFYQDQNNAAFPPLTVTIRAPIVPDTDVYTVAENSGVTPLDVLVGDVVDPNAGGVRAPSLVANGLSAVSPAGSATIAISGSNVNFTPTASFNGQVTFTYQVKDDKTPNPNTATGTVTVNVTAVNDPPTLATIGNVTINEDPVPAEQTVNLSGISAGVGETQPLQVTASTQNPTLITGLMVEYTTPNPAGVLKFTPGVNQNGSTQVTVTVTDGGPDGNLATTGDNGTFSRSFTVTVNAVNDKPVNTVPTTTQTVIETALLSFTPVISVTDVEAVAENKPVKVDLGVTNGKLNLTTTTGLTNVSGLGQGTVSFQGLVAAVNSALSTLTYQANTFPQNDTLTITTSDLGATPAPAETETDTVAITVIPGSKPGAVPDNFTVDEDSGNNAFNVLVNDIDVDSTVGPTNLIITAASDPAGGAVSVASDGKSVTYRPDDNFFGSDTFTYTIESTLTNKGDGPSKTTVFVTVSGINDSPTITMAPTGVTTLEGTRRSTFPETTNWRWPTLTPMRPRRIPAYWLPCRWPTAR